MSPAERTIHSLKEVASCASLISLLGGGAGSQWLRVALAPCYILNHYTTPPSRDALCPLVGEQKEGRDQHDTHHGVIFRHAHVPRGHKRAATAPGFPYSQCSKTTFQDPQLLSIHSDLVACPFLNQSMWPSKCHQC